MFSQSCLTGLSSGPVLLRLKKSADVIRWMGSKIAVYDLRIPREVETKGRKICPSRRTRKRGCRSSRGDRTRRSLARAALRPNVPRPVKNPTLARRNYCALRYEKWSKTSLSCQFKTEERIRQMRESLKPVQFQGPLPREVRLRRRATLQRCIDRLEGMKSRWLRATCLRSGDSLDFALARRRVVFLMIGGSDLVPDHWLDQARFRLESRRELLGGDLGFFDLVLEPMRKLCEMSKPREPTPLPPEPDRAVCQRCGNRIDLRRCVCRVPKYHRGFRGVRGYRL